MTLCSTSHWRTATFGWYVTPRAILVTYALRQAHKPVAPHTTVADSTVEGVLVAVYETIHWLRRYRTPVNENRYCLVIFEARDTTPHSTKKYATRLTVPNAIQTF